MPTEPNQWLSRDIADQGAHKLIELACPPLREAINKATHVLEECQRSASQVPDQDLPVMMTFLHLVEMADGVETLLSASAVHPAKLLLRSMFEATLTISYILKGDTKRRSFAWLVCRTHRRLSAFEIMSSKTQSGHDFRAEAKEDEWKADLEASPADEVEAAVENLRKLVKQDNYAEAEAEYRRLSKKRKPEWYSFHDGPVTIRELAKDLGQLSSYQFLYKTWSELTHAGDGGRWLTQTTSGGAAFHALRNPADLIHVAHFAISFLLSTMRKMLQKYAPGHDLKDWYVSELQAAYLSLPNIKVKNVPRELTVDPPR
jgi:Family of unknown function (DUF5677)